MGIRYVPWVILLVFVITGCDSSLKKKQLSQYGITWKFDRAYQCGRFVNGDWWVVGPVIVESVTPRPGPPKGKEKYVVKPNQFGDTALQDDDRMRNGSMVVLKTKGSQGYDSRKRNYDPRLSLIFPCTLKANRSLVSSISHDSIPNPHFLKGHFEKSNQLLKTTAVLTCLASPPPADAFRPAYAGTTKILYQAKDLKRELLSALKPLKDMPDPAEITRYFERMWMDHSRSWLRVSPQENCALYGREFSRIMGFGGCMLLLNIPPEQKEKLLVGLVQVGIDLQGLAANGMQWTADGGIWSGRKFPILLAGLMLGQEDFFKTGQRVQFHEDQQTYYGKSFWGHTVLWQMVNHHGHRTPFEEKNPKYYDRMDRRSDGYRKCCNGHSWLGIALAARWLKLVRPWGHDAFFDYCDRWMDPAEREIEKQRPGRSAWQGRATDDWITQLWKAYRKSAPEQPGAEKNRKWVWDKNNRGKWVPNPRPE